MNKKEPYIQYIDDFFNRWIKYYDLFSATIFNVYDAGVDTLDPQAGEKILDICTGTGEMAIRFAKKGAKVTAIDITEVMLNKGKEKAKKLSLDIDFQIQDARNLSYPDKSFDKVCISNALHDMPRKVRIEVLKEAYRVCKSQLTIVDYDLWKPKMLFQLSLYLINLFETPYFKSYAKEGIGPLLGEAQIDVTGLVTKRVFPGLFSVHTLFLDRKK